MEASSISYLAAFIGGAIAFFSPCILPLIPAYFSYITGLTFNNLKEDSSAEIKKTTFLHSCFFVIGFSLIFILLGASATFLGQLLFTYQELIRKIGAIVIVLFGLYIAGFIQFPFLLKEHKLNLKFKPAGYLGSAVVGMVFGFGWTPCVGPILGSILVLAGTSQNIGQGIMLLAFFSLGLAIPFLIASLAFNSFLAYFNSIKKHLEIISRLSGVLLILLGIFLWFGNLPRLS